jgi:hypothetical protein
MGIRPVGHVVFRDTTPVKCTFDEVAADDLLDAVDTLRAGRAMGRMVTLPGLGMEAINWAVDEIDLAEPGSHARHAVTAVVHARRALACWVDSYLSCFGFSLCKNRPKDSRDSTDLLVRRRVIDKLSGSVIRRVIERRNLAEHQYEEIPPEEAQDSVELIRLTLQCLRQKFSCFSDPADGHYVRSPWLLGHYCYSLKSSSKTTEVVFEWDGVSIVLCSFLDPPWLGVVEPDSPKTALVRRCAFSSMPLEVYEQIIAKLEQKFRCDDGYSELVAVAQAAGLTGGP